MSGYDVVWSFRTPNFTIRLRAEPDDDLDLSFDDSGEIRNGLDSGLYTAFRAHVEVICRTNGAVLGEDYLGGCIYESVSDFIDHRIVGAQNRAYAARGETARCGSYFTQMITGAIAEARKNYAKLTAVKLRTA